MAFHVFQQDHLRSSSQINCGTIWGSFPVWRSLAALSLLGLMRFKRENKHILSKRTKRKKRTIRRGMSAISVFHDQVKFNVEFTREAVDLSLTAQLKINSMNGRNQTICIFYEPCQSANSGHPFKVSCQGLANRKQGIFQNENHFHFHLVEEKCLRFYSLQLNEFYYFQSQFDTNQKVPLRRKSHPFY